MKMNGFALLLLLTLWSYNSVAQYQLWVKFPTSTEVKINGKALENAAMAIVINSVKPDSVHIESFINDKAVGKSFLLREEMNTYVLTANIHHQNKYRLRSNLKIDSVTELDLNTFPDFESKQKTNLSNRDSLQSQIERAHFEFEKVNLILDYLKKNTVDILYVKVLCGYLKHDFTKWRVVELTSSQTENKSELRPLLEVFTSDNYKNQLNEIIELK